MDAKKTFITCQTWAAYSRAAYKQRLFGFSQEDFAAACELNQTYMGGVERGERNIAVLNLIRIAKTLKVEIGELFPLLKMLEG